MITQETAEKKAKEKWEQLKDVIPNSSFDKNAFLLTYSMGYMEGAIDCQQMILKDLKEQK